MGNTFDVDYRSESINDIHFFHLKEKFMHEVLTTALLADKNKSLFREHKEE